MARKARERAGTGIYHVMLRGINKQDIFFDEDDFEAMQWTLAEAGVKRNAMTRKVVETGLCAIYAYCILNNHVHILLREGTMNVSQVVQKITDRYVFIYNGKYERVGHLFQGRFRSEPVNDAAYFWRLLRYIHRNPVKAMEAETPGGYAFSSWREYVAPQTVKVRVCQTEAVTGRWPLEEIVEWVEREYVADDDEGHRPLDMDGERRLLRDAEAWELLAQISESDTPDDFRQLSAERQLEYLRELLACGVSMRQASRLSSLSFSKIQRAMSESRGQTP